MYATNKALTNEFRNPFIVRLAVVREGLDVELSRQIMQFHKSRNIQPRYGRRKTTSRGKVYYRWRFSDILMARAFAEQFGGEFYKPKRLSEQHRIAANPLPAWR
jgi:hypothetical protein